ncbi:hypothetical protein OW763_11050 [Clostridium aestuarii]|uniref:Phospholipase/carboxylesterase/thioesterase domain-containing protein n=1 Tax=Clostridium aestuarii TaxID=338193 RepID=A0ABT4D0W3_9CLOT|nr:hypothetical protein [Clostridium aestuarii]MCY6484878.1 hypothetical protein [Clostridium aestuarii]
MKKSLKVIVLSAVIISTLTTISFANPASKTDAGNKLKKEKVEFKQFTKEEKIKELEESIKKLEKEYKKGLISKEKYNEMLENVKNRKDRLSKLDNLRKQKYEIKQLIKEKRIKKIEESIKKLEKEYKEGLISKEKYDEKKSNFNKRLEKVKNRKNKLSKVDNSKNQNNETEQVTKEEIINQLKQNIRKLEEKYKAGLISKEIYEEKRANFDDQLSNICELNEITADNLNSYKVGMNVASINVNGENRRFKFYVPENLPNEGVSLLFRFHGSVSTSQDPIGSITKNYILNQIANNENIIAVYPVGNIQETTFNWTDTEKNLAFFDEMVKIFEKTFDNIDSNRIYTCGHSSGAIFSFTLAGFREDKIAAAVPVSGQYNLTKTLEKSTFIGNDVSVPIRAYNGTKDEIVNHQGAYNNMCVWSEKENKGSSFNIEKSYMNIGDYNVDVKKWDKGLSDLEMYSIQDEGHGISWNTIAQSMWEFMKNHPKNK